MSSLSIPSTHLSTHSREANFLSPYSKCAVVALVIGSVAGLVFAVLGAVQLFGPIGCTGYIGSIAGGGALALLSGGGIIWAAIASGKKASPPIDHDHSSDHNSVIAFAREKLEERPDIEPYVFYDDQGKPLKNQPGDQIARLATLCREAVDNLGERLKQYGMKADPWSEQDVINKADTLFKISYAISYLTVEELPGFTENLEENCTYTDVLTRNDFYQSEAGFFLSTIYHKLRVECYWSPDAQKLVEPPRKIHASLFYQEGTIQYGWRMLYNDYCTRLRNLINDSELAPKYDVDEENWV